MEIKAKHCILDVHAYNPTHTYLYGARVWWIALAKEAVSGC